LKLNSWQNRWISCEIYVSDFDHFSFQLETQTLKENRESDWRLNPVRQSICWSSGELKLSNSLRCRRDVMTRKRQHSRMLQRCQIKFWDRNANPQVKHPLFHRWTSVCQVSWEIVNDNKIYIRRTTAVTTTTVTFRPRSPICSRYLQKARIARWISTRSTVLTQVILILAIAHEMR
jgi:hypothetical protein